MSKPPPTSCGPTSRCPSAVRWIRRRLTPVRLALLAVVTLLPDRFTGDARLAAVRVALATPSALVDAADATPRRTSPTCRRPLGFRPRARAARRAARPRPHTGWGLTAPAPSR